jgi:hypothetical protein
MPNQFPQTIEPSTMSSPGLFVDRPCDSITPVLALEGATPHWRDRTDNLAGAQIRPRRSSAGASRHSRRGGRSRLSKRSTRRRRGCGSCRNCGRQERAHKLLGKREERVFHSYHSLHHPLPSMKDRRKWYRGIPAGGVAPPSNTRGILSRRALPSGRRAPKAAIQLTRTDH